MKHLSLFLPEASDFHDIKVMGRVHIRIGLAQAILLIPLLLWMESVSDTFLVYAV